jgi:hypothetical protein
VLHVSQVQDAAGSAAGAVVTSVEKAVGAVGTSVEKAVESDAQQAEEMLQQQVVSSFLGMPVSRSCFAASASPALSCFLYRNTGTWTCRVMWSS